VIRVPQVPCELLRIHSEQFLCPCVIIGLSEIARYFRDIKSSLCHCSLKQEKLVYHHFERFSRYQAGSQVSKGYREECGAHIESFPVCGCNTAEVLLYFG